MGLYSRHVLPYLVHLTCKAPPFMRQRAAVVPPARGRVLEIGVGPGLNLALYDPARVDTVIAIDPAPGMMRRARRPAAAAPVPVTLVEATASALPLADASVDTIVVTYTMCSIPDLAGALREMRRVLRPEGTLRFCEHGASPEPHVRRWQSRIDPVWKRFSGGCNLGRPIPEMVREGGFEIRDLEAFYLPGWRPASFTYRGLAVLRAGGAERAAGGAG